MARNNFFDATTGPLTPVADMDRSHSKDNNPFPEAENKLVQVVARIPLYAYAYLEATFTGPNALIDASQAVQAYGEKQETNTNPAPQRSVAPTVQTTPGVTVDPRYGMAYGSSTQAVAPAPVPVTQGKMDIVPAEIAKLFPAGVLTEKAPSFSKTTGKPGPRYVLTDTTNGRQVSAWQNDDGTLGWGKVGPIFVPRQRN